MIQTEMSQEKGRYRIFYNVGRNGMAAKTRAKATAIQLPLMRPGAASVVGAYESHLNDD